MWTTKKLVRNCPAPAPGSPPRQRGGAPACAPPPPPVLRQPAECQIDTTHFCWLLLLLLLLLAATYSLNSEFFLSDFTFLCFVHNLN